MHASSSPLGMLGRLPVAPRPLRLMASPEERVDDRSESLGSEGEKLDSAPVTCGHGWRSSIPWTWIMTTDSSYAALLGLNTVCAAALTRSSLRPFFPLVERGGWRAGTAVSLMGLVSDTVVSDLLQASQSITSS